MEIKDIVALAHAGFNVSQIMAIANAQAQQMPQMSQMAQAQQMPQMSQMAQMPQMAQAQQMPQMPQMPQMAQAQQMPQMAQAQQIPQMAQAQQMPQTAQYSDPVLEQLKALTGAVQNSNIMNSAQPAARSADDVLAAIINPPAADKG